MLGIVKQQRDALVVRKALERVQHAIAPKRHARRICLLQWMLLIARRCNEIRYQAMTSGKIEQRILLFIQ